MDAHAYANNKVEADTDAVVKSDSEGKADVFLKGNNYKNIKTSSKKFNEFFLDFKKISNIASSITARGYTCKNECEKKLETGYFWCWLMAGPPGTTWDYCSPHNNTDITGKVITATPGAIWDYCSPHNNTDITGKVITPTLIQE